MNDYERARKHYLRITSADEITPEWIDALPGRFRPPWYHPLRRWAWDRGMLSASGDVIFWERFPGRKRER